MLAVRDLPQQQLDRLLAADLPAVDVRDDQRAQRFAGRGRGVRRSPDPDQQQVPALDAAAERRHLDPIALRQPGQFLEQAARELLEAQWKKTTKSKLPSAAAALASPGRTG